MKLILTSLSAILFSLNVFAASGSMKVVMTTIDMRAEYSATESGYSMTALSGNALVNVTGTGALAGAGQDSTQNLAEQLPDVRNGEYSKLSIERTGDNLAILHSQTLKHSEAGDITESTDAEIQITDGSWADVDAGKEVHAKLTKKGIKQEIESNKALASQAAKKMSDSLKSQGVSVSGVKFEVETSMNDLITISKTKIIQTKAMVKMTISLSARVQ